MHSSGGDQEVELTLEPQLSIGDDTFPALVSVKMLMPWRDARPHVYIGINGSEEILLELDEAEAAARLLAWPDAHQEPVVLTMMESDDALPRGHRADGRPRPEHIRFLASPFSRPAVFAAYQTAPDEVLIYTFSTSFDGKQSPRYLVLTPSEATELAAAIFKLLDGAR